MDAVAVEGLAARLDHVGMARQAQVAGAAEVQIFPAVDARQSPGGPSMTGDWASARATPQRWKGISRKGPGLQRFRRSILEF